MAEIKKKKKSEILASMVDPSYTLEDSSEEGEDDKAFDTQIDEDLIPTPEESEEAEGEDFLSLEEEDLSEELEGDEDEDEEITPEMYSLDEVGEDEEKSEEDSGVVGLGPTLDRTYDKEDQKPYEYEGPTKDAADALKQEAASEGIDLEDPDDSEQTNEGISVAFKEIPIYDKAEYLKQQNAITEEYLKEIAEAKQVYNETKDKIAQREIWDGIIKAVGLMAAAWYGNKTGVDLTGLKFDKFDSASQMEQAQEDLKIAKGFAKDVRDIKTEANDEKRRAIFAEMDSARNFNRDLMDKAHYDRMKAEFEIKKQAKKIKQDQEDQQDVLEYVKDSNAYKVYSGQKKALEAALIKYKDDPSEEALDTIRSMSETMQNSADQMTKKLGDRGAFPNEYPPNLFEGSSTTRLWGLWTSTENPDYAEVLERKSKSLETILSPEDYATYSRAQKSTNLKLKAAVANKLKTKYPKAFPDN